MSISIPVPCMTVCPIILDPVAISSSGFGEGYQKMIWLDDVMCTGNERSLQSCHHSGVGVHNCAHYEYAGVICSSSGETL